VTAKSSANGKRPAIRRAIAGKASLGAARKANGGASLRVACVQMEPHIGERDGNIERSLRFIREAARAGAEVVVLPELCNSGYVFASREEAHGLSEPIDGGPSVLAWSKAARTHGIWIAAGLAERSGGKLFNSAVLIGPEGVAGRYRKNHLWAEEALAFEPGDLGVPVFHTPRGRFSLAICYDLWFPETFRLAALGGADLLLVPTNWVPMPGQRQDLPVMANILAMSGAHSNGIFVAAADRIGVERGQPFLGCSLIIGPEGWPLAGPASPDREEILYADLDLAQARRGRTLNSFNHILRDRRPDIYDVAAEPARTRSAP
jgi:N-carbamoylputrescine amidase